MSYQDDPGWQYLRQSPEQMQADIAKIRYDPKSIVWVPDSEEGYVVADVVSTEGGKMTVKLDSGAEKTINEADAQELNPPKFLKSEDMSNLSFLNEASVLFNLRARYQDMLIYTYSGLFCVVINPYKRLPIYTESVQAMFMGKRKNEMPPHLFAASDEAYRNMLQDHQNQSMLITGESGAGKTENTKKVISYFANVGASNTGAEKKDGPTLEDQIVQTNPVLEAFGNAKTVRNNNSSRFGKFIRTHFNTSGKLAGCDIEHYLLEKSRVIKQAPGERCYHIFYQMHSGGVPGLRERLFLDDDIGIYTYVAQAELTIAGINDKEEMELTDEAFNIMNFSADEKENIYKITAALMHMGQMEFKQDRSEQATYDEGPDAANCAKLFGVDSDAFLNAMCKPRVKVGTEWVTKGQTVDQVNWGKGAMAKGVYNRLFDWLVARCNKTLSVGGKEKANFIGVLDIAGFEIFDFNSFEQIWINFVNEKLQQFFNHHMFVLEQEEYKREGIQWEFIDFGLDLAACIELIEKPMGIISMLDEECIVPKATDQTLAQKLLDAHLGKHPNMQKPKPPKGKQAEAHFALGHYAGVVRYNVTAWLEKNKDPLNDSAVGVLKASPENELLRTIWQSYQTQEDTAKAQKKDGGGGGKKKGKSGSMMTVSMLYRESLNNLMSMLKTTHPHFVRCLIPNEIKKSGMLDATLVMHQLTCNGVLEGIRICRKGFPNRMQYPDYCQRYALLAPDEAAGANDDPKAAGEKIGARLIADGRVTDAEFKNGLTKVFFKAGILARLEEHREDQLGVLLTSLQCQIRWKIAQEDYARRKAQEDAYTTIQSNIKSWCLVRTWPWFLLMGSVKPLIEKAKRDAEAARLLADKASAGSEEQEKRIKDLEAALEKEQTERQRAELETLRVTQEKAKLQQELEKEQQMRKNLEDQVKKLESQIDDLNDQIARLERSKKDLESQVATLKGNISNLEATIKAQELEKQQLHREIKTLQDEVVHLDQQIGKLTHDRKVQEETNREVCETLQHEVARAERIDGLRKKAEDALSEKTEDYEREKRLRGELDRNRKRLEGESRLLNESMEQFKAQCHDLEQNVRRKEVEMSGIRVRLDEADGQVQKLNAQFRQSLSQIEQLEEQLDQEKRVRTRAEKVRLELQEEYDNIQQRLEETTGRLHAAESFNNQRKEEMSRLYHEIDAKNLYHSENMSEMFNQQYATISRLRDISLKMTALDHDVTQVQSFISSMNSADPKLPRSASQAYISRSFSSRRFEPLEPEPAVKAEQEAA